MKMKMNSKRKKKNPRVRINLMIKMKSQILRSLRMIIRISREFVRYVNMTKR